MFMDVSLKMLSMTRVALCDNFCSRFDFFAHDAHFSAS